MKSEISYDLPPAPGYLSDTGKKQWMDTGKWLSETKGLNDENLYYLEDLCFWENKKEEINLNINGVYSDDQLTLLSGSSFTLKSSLLLSNYKAIQDEINDILVHFGLKPESPHYLSNTPPIPDDVYQHMPPALRYCCDLIDDQRKKDSFMIHALPVLSFHLSNVLIEHADGLFTPFMKCIVVNTKGGINPFARKAIDIAETLQEHSLRGQADHLKRFIYSPEGGFHKISEYLIDSHGRALIFGDRESFRLQRDFFQMPLYDELTENSFNEKSIQLSSDVHDIHILKPKLALSLRFSLEDVYRLAEAHGEKHLTHYLFYLSENELEWDSSRPADALRQFSEQIRSLSALAYRLYKISGDRNRPLYIEFEDQHWKMIDDTFREKLKLMDEFELLPSMRTMLRNSSVYVLKIASVFRMIRISDEAADVGSTAALTAQDEDVIAALWLTDTLMKHAIRLHQNLPVMFREPVKGDRFHRFYQLLPIVFDTSSALNIAARIAIPKRTANRYLSTYLDKNRLGKLRKGVYHKLN